MTFRIVASQLILMWAVPACSPPPPTVDGDNLRRIVTTLASDEMEGRRAFTEGIEKAAAFIETELSYIGLEPWSETEGFRQTFSAYQLRPANVTVVLNGMAVGPDNLFSVPGSDSIAWETGDVEILTVYSEHELRAAFGAALGSRSDRLVLVDPAAEDVFRMAKQFVAGGHRTLELGQTGSSVFVLGEPPSVETMSVMAHFYVDTLALTNLVGRIDGKRADEIVLFSAHYDHIGIQAPVEGDSIANGANDDASGVAGVMELARIFAKMDQPERTLLFSFFTAEELGGYGSRHFSEQLDPDRIVAMFNLEMIGKPATNGPNTAWITGFDKSDFGAILQRSVEGTEYSFYADPYPGQNLFYRSDNATLARKGVPAHTISTTPIDVDQDHHRVSDEAETLDFDHMANTVGAIIAGARTIVSGEATPTRVDPQQLN